MAAFAEEAIRSLREPRKAFSVALALTKGHVCQKWARLRGHRLRVGKNFRLFGSLRLNGPGEVIIGDNVVILDTVTPWTHDPSARIVIGSGTMMAGARFGAAREIRIGCHCIIAGARITDTDFHSVRADRWSEAAPIRVAPVVVEDNVWIAEAAALLPGTYVGANSVVGFGAICMGRYPADKIILGNPARVAAPIPPLPDEAAAPASEVCLQEKTEERARPLP